MEGGQQREQGATGVVRQVRLLGGVSAVTGHGQPADVGPAKCQVLLAALALSAGQAVPAGRLTELIWGAAPPRTAERTLQSYVTRLRQALGPGSIVRAGAAYRLEVPPEAVDVLRFQRRLARATSGAALAEWTGLPFAGLDGARPGRGGRRADRTVAGRGGGRPGRPGSGRRFRRRPGRRPPVAHWPSSARLTELTAAHPYRERLWELLMTALYRAGRQGDALAAYRTARQQLTEHLGVEPGPALRELESLILGQDERLLGDRQASGRPAAR